MESGDVVNGVLSVSLVVLGVVGRYVVKLLDEKITTEGLNRILGVTAKLAQSAVMETAQVYADELKDKAADGKLTKEERTEARQKALAYLKRNVGEKGLKEIQSRLGFSLGEADSFLVGQLEEAVGQIRTKRASRRAVKGE